MSVNPAGPNYPLATLYVGDLDPDITEAQLFERFSTAGPVLSIRVCRDQITKHSLGYAYVNFQQPADAERALDTMNFDLLNGRPMRIMWSQRDPSLRKTGVGNVFIKNLDKSIDNKALYDTFSTFGNILSCKIMIDEHGNSKGYGFVHFETQEAADKAITSVNNMLLNDKKVYVGKFLSKIQRFESGSGPMKKFTNVFVKNFGDQLDDVKLREIFERFGDITSAVVAKNDNGTSKGHGFVNFKDPSCAERAVKEMNEFILNDKKLAIGPFQKKSERIAELKRKFEEEKRERFSKYQGVNLYIKNLDDKIDDEKLRKEFEPYGTITSAKVMVENGRSKGFGFVCFSAPEEATKAVTEMNSRIIGSKPLYVALAQRKEDRRNHLTNQYMQRIANMRMQNQQLGQIGYNAQNAAAIAHAGMFMPAAQLQNAAAAARIYSAAPMYPQVRPTPRWAAPSQTRAGAQATGAPQNSVSSTNAQQNAATAPQYQAYQMLSQTQQRARLPINAAAANAAATLMRPTSAQQQARINYNPMTNAAAAAYMRNGITPINGTTSGVMQQQQRQQQQQQSVPQQQQQQMQKMQQYKPQQMNPQAINVPGQEPLTTDMLASAHPQEQKQLLGERLYPLIQQMHPEWAGKITGMLLEIDNAELLHMLDSRESLKDKVEEAVSVLKAHQVKQQVQQLQVEQ